MKTLLIIAILGLTLSLNAQKTNFIGKDLNQIKTSLVSFVCFSNIMSLPDNFYCIAFTDQYFGTLIYKFNKKNICISYVIKSSVAHKSLIETSLNLEFPVRVNDTWKDGTYSAHLILEKDILTVSVK